MKCPACRTTKLVKTEYEGVSVHHCEQCQGHLVRKNRITAIKVKRSFSDEEFLSQVDSATGNDTPGRPTCSGCLRGMSQRKMKVGLEEFYVNDCDDCSLVWFDGGELAKLQLEYENTDQAQELFRFRERLESMTDQERADLDARIAKLGGERIFDSRDYAIMAYWCYRFN